MDEIFNRWGTDKNTTHSYLDAYESIMAPRRTDKVRILEIGIFSGASLFAWAEYFSHPDTRVIGIDMTTEHLRHTIPNPKVLMHIFDATIKENIESINGEFDFIIDDGSHILVHQMRSFELLKDKLTSGGVYIIEDIMSIDNANTLMNFVQNFGFNVKLYDTRQAKGRYDDIMLVINKA